MKNIFLPVTVLVLYASLAAADCRVIEYPDHFEAVCGEGAKPTPAMPHHTEQEQNVATVQTNVTEETPDVPPEQIVRNDLARLHMASWLKAMPGR